MISGYFHPHLAAVAEHKAKANIGESKQTQKILTSPKRNNKSGKHNIFKLTENCINFVCLKNHILEMA